MLKLLKPVCYNQLNNSCFLCKAILSAKCITFPSINQVHGLKIWGELRSLFTYRFGVNRTGGWGKWDHTVKTWNCFIELINQFFRLLICPPNNSVCLVRHKSSYYRKEKYLVLFTPKAQQWSGVKGTQVLFTPKCKFIDGVKGTSIFFTKAVDIGKQTCGSQKQSLIALIQPKK